MNLEGQLTSNGALLEQLALNNNGQRQLVGFAVGDGTTPLTAQSNALSNERFRTAEMQVFYNREDNTKIDIICNLPDEVPIATIKEIGIFDDFNYLHVVANVDTVERQFRVTFTPVDPAAVFAQVDDSPEVVTKEFVRAEIAQHNDDANAHAGLKQAVENVAGMTNLLGNQLATISTRVDANTEDNTAQSTAISGLGSRLSSVEALNLEQTESLNTLTTTSNQFSDKLNQVKNLAETNANTTTEQGDVLDNLSVRLTSVEADNDQTGQTLINQQTALNELQTTQSATNENLQAIQSGLNDVSTKNTNQDGELNALSERLRLTEATTSSHIQTLNELSAAANETDQNLLAVQRQCDSQGDSLNQQASTLTSQGERLSSLESSSATNRQSIESLSSAFGTLQNQVQLNSTKVNGNATAIGELTSSMTTLGSRLGNVESRASSNTSNLNSLTTTVNQQGQGLTAINSRSSNNATAIGQHTNAINGLTSRMTSVESKATNNANSLSNISSRVNNLETKITVSASNPSGGSNGDIWFKV